LQNELGATKSNKISIKNCLPTICVFNPNKLALPIQNYLMKFLHSEIGSAKDNATSPVHNWYKFTAGFSHKFVDEIIHLQKLKSDPKSKIFDPFAGCGTTLVSAQKAGVKAVGNESQDFMYAIIRAKLNWKIDPIQVKACMVELKQFIAAKKKNYELSNVVHPLLLSLYKPATLKTIYLIKDYIKKIRSTNLRLFFKLALSQTLHKVSIHPIAVPYIVRSKTLSPSKSPWLCFSDIVKKMLIDTNALSKKVHSSQIYKHDSRFRNNKIKANSCKTCITSPPYLNNLDYGEISKVHTHFFGITDNWNDITRTVRKKLVTGSTTHYTESDFSLSTFKKSTFYKNNKTVGNKLIKLYEHIKKTSDLRLGKKSFHILMLLYFQDMHKVLLEIRRTLAPNCKAFLILGDSAPYGVFVPTTKILGQIALKSGFQRYRIIKIRTRGGKWKDLKYRHSQELSENVLILQ
jgi:DNA modification methylase